jgi:hypothetical protein
MLGMPRVPAVTPAGGTAAAADACHGPHPSHNRRPSQRRGAIQAACSLASRPCARSARQLRRREARPSGSGVAGQAGSKQQTVREAAAESWIGAGSELDMSCWTRGLDQSKAGGESHGRRIEQPQARTLCVLGKEGEAREEEQILQYYQLHALVPARHATHTHTCVSGERGERRSCVRCV